MTPQLKSKHSPAPWIADEAGYIYGADGEIVAQVFDNPDTGIEALGEEPSEFNTRLIVAAPEMLDALRSIALNSECEDWLGLYAPRELRQIKAAIEKVTEGNKL